MKLKIYGHNVQIKDIDNIDDEIIRDSFVYKIHEQIVKGDNYGSVIIDNTEYDWNIIPLNENVVNNLKKYLKSLGFSEEKIEKIANGDNDIMNEDEDPDGCLVVLEITLDEDLEMKYPNYIFNYEDRKSFLDSQVSSLNQYIQLDECLVYKEYHPQNEIEDYEISDYGFKQRVLKVEFKNMVD